MSVEVLVLLSAFAERFSVSSFLDLLSDISIKRVGTVEYFLKKVEFQKSLDEEIMRKFLLHVTCDM